MLSKISNIISLNPTGTITLDNNGTMKMNGQNNIIQTPSSQAKENLEKINNNKFICNKGNNDIIEKFDNINSSKSIYTYFLYFVLIIFIFISFFIFKKFLYKK